MGLDATARRRLFGTLFLLAALGLLIVGQTVLKNRLSDLAFLIYWMVCFFCTVGAILVAYLDVRALNRRSRREAHDLLHSTISEIESDAKKKHDRAGDKRPRR
jgi:hypothetical protein